MGQGCSHCFDGLVAATSPGQRPVHTPPREPPAAPAVPAVPTAPAVPAAPAVPVAPAATAAPGAKLAAALAEAPKEDVIVRPTINGYTACMGQAVVEVETTVKEVPPEVKAVEGTFTKLYTKPAMMEDVSSDTEDSVELETPSGTCTTAAELGPDGLPSIGSVGHATGDCKRCCFHPKGRCQNGHDCRFCHFDHDKRRRAGTKKKSSRQVSPDSSMTGDGISPVLTPAMGQQPMALIPGPQAPCQPVGPCATTPSAACGYPEAQPHMEAPQMAMGCMEEQVGYAPPMMPNDYGNMPMWQGDVPGFMGPCPLSTAPQGPQYGWPGPPNFFAHHQQHQLPPPMPFQSSCPPMNPGFNGGPPLMLPNYTTSAGRPLPELLGVPPFAGAPPPLSSLAPPLGPPPPMSTVPMVTTPISSLPNAPAPAPTQAPEPVPEKKDSPRSVILKLTGAWGALANGKHATDGDAGAFGVEACGDVLSRQNLLDLRFPQAMPPMCVPPAR